MIEKKLLALCLRDRKNLLEAMQRNVKAEFFTLSETQAFYKILLWFHKNYPIEIGPVIPSQDALLGAINQSTLPEALRGTIPVLYIELNALTVVEPIAFLFDCLVKEYKERSLRNMLAGVVDDLDGKRTDETILKIKKTLAGFESFGVVDSKEGDYRDNTEERTNIYNIAKTSPIIGIPYGFQTLDAVTGGHQKGELWVVCGFLKSGKSGMLLNMSNHAWRAGHNVLFISAEVSKRVLERRLDALNTSLSSTLLKRGALADDEEILYKAKLEEIKKQSASFYIIDRPGMTTDAIAAKVQEFKTNKKIDLLVVDYLGLISSGKRLDSDWQEKSQVALDLRYIARSENIPVLTAHQMNREGGKKGKAHATQIANSLAILMHADLGMSIKIQDEDEKQNSPICTLDASIMVSRDSATVSFQLEAIFDKMQILEPLRLT